MSLIATEEDRKHDRILKHLEPLVDYLQRPYGGQVDKTANPEWDAALCEYRRLIPVADDYLSHEAAHFITCSEVEHWVKIFDTLCCNDNMTKYAASWAIQWVAAEDPRAKEFRAENTVDNQNNITIRFVPSAHRSAIALFGTLLHEMVHILIALWTNHSKALEGELDETATEVYKRLYGQTGHGYYWHTLARAVEDRARLVLETDQIYLLRFWSFVHEWKETGKVPDLKYFEAFFEDPKYPNQMSPREVRSMVKDMLKAIKEQEKLEAQEKNGNEGDGEQDEGSDDTDEGSEETDESDDTDDSEETDEGSERLES